MGDMNYKIGNVIRWNKEEVTVGGKMMIEMVRKHKLVVVNGWENRRDVDKRVKGKW